MASGRVAHGAGFGEVVGLGREPACRHAHAAHDRLLRAEAEPALGFVLVVEALGEVEQAGLVERGAFGHGHAHVEVLARVTHLHVERRDGLGRVEAGRFELLGDLAVELRHERVHAAEVDLRQRRHVGAHEVDHVVGDEHAERRERGRRLRHVGSFDAELPRDRAACTAPLPP